MGLLSKGAFDGIMSRHLSAFSGYELPNISSSDLLYWHLQFFMSRHQHNLGTFFRGADLPSGRSLPLRTATGWFNLWSTLPASAVGPFQLLPFTYETACRKPATYRSIAFTADHETPLSPSCLIYQAFSLVVVKLVVILLWTRSFVPARRWL